MPLLASSNPSNLTMLMAKMVVKDYLKLSVLSGLFLREKLSSFLENASILRYEFLYDNLMHFQGEVVHFFPQK